MKKRVLVIDDDADMCVLLDRFLTNNGYEVETAHSGKKGIDKFKAGFFDIVLCDYRLGDKKDGKDILVEIKQHNPATIVLIITGYSDIKLAVDVIKAGAYDYITKPLIPDEVLSILSKALNQPIAQKAGTGFSPKDVKGTKSPYRKTSEFLEGQAPAAKELYKQIDIVAPTILVSYFMAKAEPGKKLLLKPYMKKVIEGVSLL